MSEKAALEAARSRIVEAIERLDDLQDLMLVELVALVPEAPFEEESALEVVLSITGFVRRHMIHDKDMMRRVLEQHRVRHGSTH